MATCKICSFGETIREAVDSMIDAKKFLDVITAETNILLAQIAPGQRVHRSAVWRHRKNCYNLRARNFLLRQRQEQERDGRRVVIQYSDDSLFGALSGKLIAMNTDTGSQIISESELQPNDALVGVGFEPVKVYKPAPKPEEPPKPDTPTQ